MGWQKHHIISIPFTNYTIYILCNSVIFFIVAPCIFASNIICNKKRFLFLIKCRLCVNFIILRITAEQSLIILDRQKRSGKQNGTTSFLHTLLQVTRRVYAEQFQHKILFICKLAINNIMTVHNLIHI